MDYLKRELLPLIGRHMNGSEIIAVTGARQTGKTTLCLHQIPEQTGLSADYISFDDPDERFRFQKSAVSILESTEKPLVILDEVQKAPFLFDPLKFVFDSLKMKTGKKKIFIITGSSQLLLIENIRETLAGRIALFNLYPFSLNETISGTDPPLLDSLWSTQHMGSSLRRFETWPAKDVRRITAARNTHLRWGGFPQVWQKTDEEGRAKWLKDYRKTYLERDIADVGQVSSIDTFALVQKLLCARTAGILSVSEVARDASVSVNTIKRYISLLAMTYQCTLLQPFIENVSKRLIKSPKIYFNDTGLIGAVLGDTMISQGALYESWVLSELIKWKQRQRSDPKLYFFRTSAGLEIDFLIAAKNTLLPIEVKSGENVSSADGRSIEAFMKEHKKVAHIGIVVYPGKEAVEIRKNIWAIPDLYLFGGI